MGDDSLGDQGTVSGEKAVFKAIVRTLSGDGMTGTFW